MNHFLPLRAGLLGVAASTCLLAGFYAHAQSDKPVKDMATVVVTGTAASSLPSQIPTTIEGVDKDQIEQSINATDSEDALKYLPSLLIRKRYIGDYNHAVLASRASGTNNSARSVVYADGILLSNFLGNGAAYAPRWGMVTPEEIERVDVLYGPFSAAYPGNSVGAIVDYQTKMPTAFEAHGKVGVSHSPYSLYNTQQSAKANQISASVGNKQGDWAWWLNFNKMHSVSHPMGWLLKAPCTATCTGTATPVSGAVATLDRFNAPVAVLGTTTAYDTFQDHAKIKLAYDFSPTLRASYSFGFWNNQSQGRPQTYLTNASGAPVYSGVISSDGNKYAVGASDFTMSNEQLQQHMHAITLKTHTKERWDWSVAFSQYRYAKDDNRAPTTYANGVANGAGTITDTSGTGWSALSTKATYRPDGMKGAHIVDVGYQRDAYKLSQIKSNLASNWTGADAGSLNTDIGGQTQLHSVWGQDTWRVAKDWKAVLGLRSELWRAENGHTNVMGVVNPLSPYGARTESALSPKAALAFQADASTVLKTFVGRAVRFPTVQELYGSTSTATSSYVNDANLKPEKSVTSEWSVEKNWTDALLRGTLFFEDTRNSLYAQTTFEPLANAGAGSNVTRISNIDRIKTQGLEISYQGVDILTRGLDLSGSLTYAESKIVANTGYVVTPGDTLGRYQPRVPLARATAVVGYRWSDKLTTSLGARYSGKQYTSLNNADVNGFAYQGASKFFVMDARLRYQVNKESSFALGIDNLNNYQYWNFHPYPQRTFHAELRVDWK